MNAADDGDKKAVCSRKLRKSVIVFLLLLIGPVAVSAVKYLVGDRSGDWQTADRSGVGLLPAPVGHSDSLIRDFAARKGRWRGIFPGLSWVVFQEMNARRLTTVDCIG